MGLPTILFVVAAVVGVADWVAVWQRLFRLEYLLKPLTLALLVAVALTAQMSTIRPQTVAALALGLVGDIALLFSTDEEGESTQRRVDVGFLAGLAAFLLGHVAYGWAFLHLGVRAIDVLAGLLIVAGISAVALPAVLRGAARTSGRGFAMIVAGYAVALGAMAVLAVGTGVVLTAIGGVVFLVSDTTLAWQRFVRRLPYGDLAVIVTYHVAQGLILVGLIRAN